MKKIIILLLAVVMLCGCATSKRKPRITVEPSNPHYHCIESVIEAYDAYVIDYNEAFNRMLDCRNPYRIRIKK